MVTATVGRPVSHTRLYRLSVEQYDQLARAGVLKKSDRVELIEGLLVEKITKNSRHLTTSWLINQALVRVLPLGWFAVVEAPIVLVRSEPEPDIMVVRGRVQDYFGRKPHPGDVALIVEVSDSSYSEDYGRRALFAEAGVPFYWIAHIPAQRIEAYSEPIRADSTFDYQSRHDYGISEAIPLIIEGRETTQLAVKELLAPLTP